MVSPRAFSSAPARAAIGNSVSMRRLPFGIGPADQPEATQGKARRECDCPARPPSAHVAKRWRRPGVHFGRIEPHDIQPLPFALPRAMALPLATAVLLLAAALLLGAA